MNTNDGKQPHEVIGWWIDWGQACLDCRIKLAGEIEHEDTHIFPIYAADEGAEMMCCEVCSARLIERVSSTREEQL
jgi:hypothetical protein